MSFLEKEPSQSDFLLNTRNSLDFRPKKRTFTHKNSKEKLSFEEQITQNFQIKDESFSKTEETPQKYKRNSLLKFLKEPEFSYQSIKETYEDFITELIVLIQNENLRELYVATMLIHAKICIESKETLKSIAILKQAKQISKELSLFPQILKCYERLGKAFSLMKKFTLAQRYFFKMLELSWVINSKSKELLSYDLIGLQCYYLGDLSLANHFHKKLLQCEIAPNDSNLRQIAVSKYKNKHKNHNYSLPSYIAARNENFEKNETLMTPSSEDEMKIEELLDNCEEKNPVSIGKKAGYCPVINAKLITENANSNIRRAKKPSRIKSLDLDADGALDFNKFIKKKGFEHKNINPTFLLLNHLSPNRYFTKPNIYEFRMSKLAKEENSKLEKKVLLINERLSDKILTRLQGFVAKYRNNIRVSLMQIEFYFTKSKDGSKRKNALLCSPLLKNEGNLNGNSKENMKESERELKKKSLAFTRSSTTIKSKKKFACSPFLEKEGDFNENRKKNSGFAKKSTSKSKKTIVCSVLLENDGDFNENGKKNLGFLTAKGKKTLLCSPFLENGNDFNGDLKKNLGFDRFPKKKSILFGLERVETIQKKNNLLDSHLSQNESDLNENLKKNLKENKVDIMKNSLRFERNESIELEKGEKGRKREKLKAFLGI